MSFRLTPTVEIVFDECSEGRLLKSLWNTDLKIDIPVSESVDYEVAEKAGDKRPRQSSASERKRAVSRRPTAEEDFRSLGRSP